MTKRLNITKLAEDNPKVDLKSFRKAVKAIRELRALGVRPREYSLLSPYDSLPLEADTVVSAEPLTD